MKLNLQGRVVAITGGGRGIGAATAREFARAGARVAVGDLDATLAKEVAAEFDGLGCCLDVREPESFSAFLDAVEDAMGGIDILVNNAGIMPVVAFTAETAESIDRQLDVNLRAVIWGTQEAIRRMSRRGEGHIVNVSSVAGMVGIPGVATYNAAKHGVFGLTEALRREMRDTDIDLTVVAPGHVRTELTAGVTEHWLASSATPEEVAEAIVRGVRRKRARVQVPRRMGLITAVERALPARVSDFATRITGAGKTLTEGVNPGDRAAYDRRMTR